MSFRALSTSSAAITALSMNGSIATRGQFCCSSERGFFRWLHGLKDAMQSRLLEPMRVRQRVHGLAASVLFRVQSLVVLSVALEAQRSSVKSPAPSGAAFHPTSRSTRGVLQVTKSGPHRLAPNPIQRLGARHPGLSFFLIFSAMVSPGLVLLLWIADQHRLLAALGYLAIAGLASWSFGIAISRADKAPLEDRIVPYMPWAPWLPGYHEPDLD